MRETRQVRRGGCRKDDTLRDFDLVNPELIFHKYRLELDYLSLFVKSLISPVVYGNKPAPGKRRGCSDVG
jgi:hypothetical protein